MANKKRRISGPGAADFLTAPGGEDIPGASPSKGESELAGESPLTDARNLEPDLEADVDQNPHHLERGVPRGRDETDGKS
jgi:hypothetical protein